MNTNNLEIFTFHNHDVRVVIKDGEPWWVASDVAKVLEYRDANYMFRGVDQEEKGYAKVRTPGGEQNLTIVNESGLYTAIIRSKTDRAKPFRKWVTAEVLPSIRKNGSYNAAALSDDEIIHRALTITTHRVAELESIVSELQPKAECWSKLADSTGDYSVADAAKILCQDPQIDIGRDRLYAFMLDKRWVYRPQGRRTGFCAYQSQVDIGRLRERMNLPFLNKRTGQYELSAPTVRVTAKGLEKLHSLLTCGQGQLALGGGGLS